MELVQQVSGATPFQIEPISSDALSSTGHAYPRPMLRRGAWWPLNGKWQFMIDADDTFRLPQNVPWEHTITVPFAPETLDSGINYKGFFKACWYRRMFEAPQLTNDARLLLHFGAVDHIATVWINGIPAATHEGGYTPFTVDVTDYLMQGGPQIIVVRVEDDPADLSKPRGKQDWQLKPHSIWYERTTGIWQTVWLEQVPATWIGQLRWAPNIDRWEISFEAWLNGTRREDLRIGLKLAVGDKVLVDDTYAVVANEVHRRIALSDPGIDDYRNELLWRPQTPTLIQADVRLWAGRGDLIDAVRSYTALRSIETQGDRFVLNGRPYNLRLVLDQGLWDETGLTAPNDAALRKDVELAMNMGFNGVRKHQKIEDPRYLYWADTLGLLVWEEMPSAYRFTKNSVERLTREWSQVIARDYSHPCIIAWVPINESWGVPNLPSNAAERHYVQALYHLTKTLDPSRPVVGNDGWESVATDIIGIHDYDDDVGRIARRYHGDTILPKMFKQERPGGRILLLGDYPEAGHPIVLSEFGGIAFMREGAVGWGYSQSSTADGFREKFSSLMEVVRSLGMFAGFCYTQFADTYQECNGLLYSDRTPKFPLEEMAAAVRGVTPIRVVEPIAEKQTPKRRLPSGTKDSAQA